MKSGEISSCRAYCITDSAMMSCDSYSQLINSMSPRTLNREQTVKLGQRVIRAISVYHILVAIITQYSFLQNSGHV